MIKRNIEKVIDYSIQHFPCTILTGPRQVGKTTILSNVFQKKGYKYVTLDNTSDRLLAINNPSEFLKIHGFPLIIDEAQKAVELFPEIEYIVNEQRRKFGNNSANGMYILSGSSRKNLLEKAKESLAGRASILNMESLSISELNEDNNEPFLLEIDNLINKNRKPIDRNETLNLIVKGMLPELYDDPSLQSSIFYSSYINTYMEKDIKDEVELKDENKFYNLLTLIASLTGQELIYDNISKQIGVSAITIKTWISIMVKTGIIYLVQPYYENSITKRIVKRPKLYFFDTGLACHLLGIDSAETLDKSFFKGRLFETFVVNEIKKTYTSNGETPFLYYYRDSNQNEIDLILIRNGTIHCIECKIGNSNSISDAKSFNCINESKYNKGNNAIIDTSDKISSLSRNTFIIPYWMI